MANTHSAVFDLSEQQYAGLPGASCPNYKVTEGTFGGWANINPSAPDDQWTLFAKRTNAGGEKVSYHMYLEGGGGLVDNIYFQYTLTGSGIVNRAQAVSVPKNEWHHYACVYNATSGIVRFYLDGLPLGNSLAYPGAIWASDTAPFWVGSRDSYPFHHMEGALDQLCIWNTVKNDAEVFAYYDKEQVGNEAGLVAYLELNNNWVDSASGYTLIPGAGAAAPTFQTDHAPIEDLEKTYDAFTEGASASPYFSGGAFTHRMYDAFLAAGQIPPEPVPPVPYANAIGVPPMPMRHSRGATVRIFFDMASASSVCLRPVQSNESSTTSGFRSPTVAGRRTRSRIQCRSSTR